MTTMPEVHPSQAAILKFFDYKHLPIHLQSVSRPFCDLAYTLVGEELTQDGDLLRLSGPELTVALRRLLEAKDAAVRAAL